MGGCIGVEHQCMVITIGHCGGPSRPSRGARNKWGDRAMFNVENNTLLVGSRSLWVGALVIDLGHLMLVGKILFATFRLYSDNLLQATSSGSEVSKIYRQTSYT